MAPTKQEIEQPERESSSHKHLPEVVVVTGASAGVGRAIVRAFARERAHVALLARGRDGLEGARREVKELGGKALVIPLDVADAEAVEQAAETVEREFGPIDIWINNAMVSVFSPVKLMKPEEYKRVAEVTYLGVVYGTLAALKRMLPRDRGVIFKLVRLSPIEGFHFNPLTALRSMRFRDFTTRCAAS